MAIPRFGGAEKQFAARVDELVRAVKGYASPALKRAFTSQSKCLAGGASLDLANLEVAFAAADVIKRRWRNRRARWWY